ncbi:diguanylate cyclase [Eubacterium sp. am_0171]|uniref:diguanylate cyclase n=1 Tax=unclassified Eubacterium (in: firmicutes) TaxID=2624479 RepID=UPI0010228AF0|nr:MULTISPECIES: diguanylate cyclase [unclassified Eubacterium (in: firmicutes)]MSC84448.1 diguanylate cyclase [Eubacterium sp. BIOML-A1]MSD06826.1 diguanylate cyclase [Eubacterium sp. BIOML-A2]RYT17876.1 diguanylate cyclase [Eubacterium sp. am_0171]
MNRDTILIVDDMEVNRAILHVLFEQEYNLLEAENGEQALMLIKQYRESLAAVLLDVVMPVKDGFQVMQEMGQNGLMTNIPVIIITSEDSMENEVRAFDMGASDIIIKPFEPHVVRRRVRNAVELNRHKMHLEEMLQEQTMKVRESRDVIMDTLSSIIEHRSAETGQHVLRIRKFTGVLLEDVMYSCPEYELNERAIQVIAEAAALHDIGKIAIADTILNKPGRLTDEEFEIMKKHTVKGCEILSSLGRMGDEEYLKYAYNICRYHHERWDGKGYPDGLIGDNTPVYAQAVVIADAYDALTTDRVYKKAIQPEQALNMILNGECGMFSPKLLECLKNVRIKFFRLTREYADGNLPGTAFKYQDTLDPVLHTDQENAPKLEQMKYFALLRHLDSTVVELDMDSGVYHLVYQQNEDFQDLRSGSTFEESLSNFIDHAIYPDDRPLVEGILGEYMENFFKHGLIKRTRSYRVLHRESGEYIWYKATSLRVNIESPKQHKVLIIWEREDPEEIDEKVEGQSGHDLMTENLPAGILQCMNDQWFTTTYLNHGIISLFGYTRKEIKEKFHDRYIEMIHPKDQPAVHRHYREQLSEGRAQTLEYRILTREGAALWVLEKCRLIVGADGIEYVNCILTDISGIKKVQEQMALSMERYRIIMNQTNDITFEGDLEKHTISYSSNWEKKFGYKPLSKNIFAEIQKASHIFPEDLPALLELMKSASAGIPYGETEVRIANAQGKYLWCRIRVTTQFNEEKKPVRVIGVIIDIDGEKRQIKELSAKVQMDSLTKVFNKDTAVGKIRRRLEWAEEAGYTQTNSSDCGLAGGGSSVKRTKFALMIIDLDNFKQVNDSMGHMFGDAVLAEAAAKIKDIFRGGDIIARFGGDEFLVFLEYNTKGEFLHKKAEKIIRVLKSIYHDKLSDLSLTCSIGIALFPEDGLDFQNLFQKCDRALYHAKQSGKNGYAFYDAAVMQKSFVLNTEQSTAAGTRIDSYGEEEVSVDSIVPESFQKLYESGDIEEAVRSILEMVGMRYNVSRVYIFENSVDGTRCTNTFEWCNEGIEPEIGGLRNIEYKHLGCEYQNNFDENGIFYCQDISDFSKKKHPFLYKRNIRSMLQCAVSDEGRFAGFVGFDDCLAMRLWTRNQIDALKFIAEFLSTFLLKKRAQDRALEAAENLDMILDNQNSWIYVIDPDSYRLLYINAKTRDTVPDARTGMCCHKAFFHRESPCELCPVRGIKSIRSKTMEVYNPVLDVWSIADACMIKWGSDEACLLACHDITPYKSEQDKRGQKRRNSE